VLTLKSCLENAQREIKNEKDFKQKFIDFDQKQEARGRKFADTVMKSQALRNMHKETVMDHKPAYYDMIENEHTQYNQKKLSNQQSAWKFQKDQINQKYKQMSENSNNKTKMGTQSWAEHLKDKEYMDNEKSENKARQSDYYKFLKSQINMKENKNQLNQADLAQNVFLGAYKVKKNGVPMVPGISSVSPMVGKPFKEESTMKRHRMSYEQLPNTLDLVGTYKSRNGMKGANTSMPEVKQQSKSLL